MTPEEFRRLGHDAVDLIADYLGRLPDGPVFRPVPPAAATAFATAPVPTAGSPADTVLAEFAATVAPYPTWS